MIVVGEPVPDHALARPAKARVPVCIRLRAFASTQFTQAMFP
jgi:hypothetical protein